MASLATGTLLIGATAGPASADPLPTNLEKYANCPVQNPDVTACIVIKTYDTKIQMGDWDLETTDPVNLEFGLKFDPVTFAATAVPPANGQDILTAGPIEVPGGLLGIPGTGVGPLATYATPKLIGLPKVNIANMLQRKGYAFELDLKAKIDNPFVNVLAALGTGCHVGSDSDPIPLRLTTGTTTPPAPNTPISGGRGVTKVDGEPLGGLRFEGVKTVDNSFRAPGAHGCGVTGLLNSIVNSNGGVPAAGGTNTAVLESNVFQVDADTVRAALQAPGNKVSDAGFEGAGMGPWACDDQCGVDEGLGYARTGANNGWVRNIAGWNDIHQTVSVAPNTDYTLTGWIRTSSIFNKGYFGVRKLDDTVISEKKYNRLNGYTQQTVQFNSGNNTQVRVFGGIWAIGDNWARFDDLSLTAD